ncbi:hypothetical protein QKW35_20485 [Pontibacterium granulatum]|uniref:hypothetical protein n=1 Tax=Pontibacterium granulatum TaxID=2036029 RepID=UPI00249B2880|nr:hypothetical protein [Pontibacterium granulatum]MDI3326761.1 hypothetical protein [Pontibacterium granulatum]
MKYKLQYIEAVNRSDKLDLVHKGKVLPLKAKPIKDQKLRAYYDASYYLLAQLGCQDTGKLVRNCANIHYNLYKFLTDQKLPCQITIGEFHRQGRMYAKYATTDELIEEMKSPNYGEQIDLHTWLTLPDGSAMDWTILPDMLALDGRLLPSLGECCIHVEANEHDPEHYYVPQLVGASYLENIGAVHPF